MLETANPSVVLGAGVPSKAGTAAKPTSAKAEASRSGKSGLRRQAATTEVTGGVETMETMGHATQEIESEQYM